MKLAAIVLAAGRGTRLKSELPKVLHPVGFRPMIECPIRLAQELGCDPIVVVVGHQADQVKQALADYPKVSFANQLQPLGSGHAVLSAVEEFKNYQGNVLILSGDVPLVQVSTVRALQNLHRDKNYALTLASFEAPLHSSYGRIVRNQLGEVSKIVEVPDLRPEEQLISEVNGGLYLAKAPLLFEALQRVQKNLKKGEYYFTDLPEILQHMGATTGALKLTHEEDLLGVNTRHDLAVVERVMQKRFTQFWMNEGVTFLNPERVLLSDEVTLSADCILEPDVVLRGKTQLGAGCHIEQGSILKNATLEEFVEIKAYSYLENCHVGAHSVVGPFARLRPETVLADHCRVGNFVELKKTQLGIGSKANHLAYLGDAIIGNDVNIGAGTITCNYDGVNKFQTIIEDEVFIGSDSQLVAPVTIRRGAYVAAGTTVTKEVPAEHLALTRTPQTHVAGYAQRKKKKRK